MHVTVLIPVYNRESFIGDAIDSVFDQHYTDWDILVVDDGSTNRTVEVVKSRMSEMGSAALIDLYFPELRMDIKRCFGNKFMRLYASIIDGALPDGTRRGEIKRKIINRIRNS